MPQIDPYEPGSAGDVQIRQDGEQWTLILVRELRHAPDVVWQALTEPAQLHAWAPFDVDRNLGAVGPVNLTWVGAGAPMEVSVTQAEGQRVLEVGGIRWELEPDGRGTRLTLWHSIDRRFVSMGAAGWHIALDVLNRLLDGAPVGRIVGPDAMKFPGWQRLNKEYASQFGVEAPSW